MREGTITDLTVIENIVNTYYEQHYDHKFTKLEEIHRFLEKYILPNVHDKKSILLITLYT